MRDIIVKLAKHITDCMDVTLGKTKMDETRPEYWMLDEILTDEMAQLIPTEKEMQAAMEEIRQNPQQFKFSA